MGDVEVFTVLTVILVLLGLFMPFCNSMFGESSDADVSSLETSSTSFVSFASSMLKAFFWYYGDLIWWANAFKIVINIIWIYLLVRLVRGV